MGNLYTKLILGIMDSDFYHWFAFRVFPYLRFSNYYSEIEGWQYKRAYDLLKNGDMILATDKKKASALVIGGDLKHVGICVDKHSEWEISEMTHVGYRKSTFFDMCKESDIIVVVRGKRFDDDYIKNVFIPNVKSYENVGYDLSFEFGVKALYCSELVYVSDVEKRLNLDTSDLVGIGREYVSPQAIFDTDQIEVIYDSRKDICPEWIKKD